MAISLRCTVNLRADHAGTIYLELECDNMPPKRWRLPAPQMCRFVADARQLLTRGGHPRAGAVTVTSLDRVPRLACYSVAGDLEWMPFASTTAQLQAALRHGTPPAGATDP